MNMATSSCNIGPTPKRGKELLQLGCVAYFGIAYLCILLNTCGLPRAQAQGGISRRALARPPDEESEAGPSLPELLRGIWGNSPSRVLLAQCSVLNARPAVTKFHSVTHCSVQSALTTSWTHLSYFAQVT